MQLTGGDEAYARDLRVTRAHEKRSRRHWRDVLEGLIG